LFVGDRRAQRIVHLKLQGFGDVERGVIGERCGAIEPAPGHQHASGRTGIVAAVAQEKHIAQRRLVLAAARDPRAGGRGLQRQAPPPRPVEGHLCPRTRPAIEHGERGAGPKRGLVDRRIVAGPARQRRRNRKNCVCARCLRGADHGESYHATALLTMKTC
jgi:hypothetical protein